MSSVPSSISYPDTAPQIAVTQASYDDVPYGSFPVPSSHPDKLHDMAKLFGLTPVRPECARILEIGCAGGGNLLPFASLFPNSTCVGVELSQVQCENGQQAINFAELKNVTIQQGSVTDIDASLGEFDYILCHGVYSWVPEDVREAILRVCSQNLSKNGIAYVSYNALPGWYFRGMIRGMILEHVKGIKEPVKRVAQARAFLHFLVESNANVRTPHADYIRSEVALLDALPDSYLLHEHMEAFNQAFYFRDFIIAATKHNLQFLGEAAISSTWTGNLSREAQKSLEGVPDAINRGHYMDCITGRSFRETYLVHADCKIDRSLELAKLGDMRFCGEYKEIGSNFDPQSKLTTKRYLSKNKQTVSTSDPLWHDAMSALSAQYPNSFSAEELTQSIHANNPKVQYDTNRILGTLVHGVLGGWVEFRFLPDRMIKTPPTQPKVTKWCASQAQASRYVTNLKHEFITISDVHRQVLPLLDGTRDFKAISDEIGVLIATGLINVTVDGPKPSQHELEILVTKRLLAELGQQAFFLSDSLSR